MDLNRMTIKLQEALQTASSVVQIYKTLGSSIGRTHKRVDIAAWFAAIAAGLLAVAVIASRLLEGRIP